MNDPAPYFVGIAGGTGSGKTTLARTICELLGADTVTVIEADCYYRDLSHIPVAERHLMNFDQPDAMDVDLLAAHLQQLRRGHTVRTNAYDFTTHCRSHTMITLTARPIVLIEGIFVLTSKLIENLLDLKVYIDEHPDVRRLRRIERDVMERGRTQEMSSRQYTNHVLPMHERYVEPGMRHADIILHSSTEIDLVLPVLRAALIERGITDAAKHTGVS